MNARLAAVALVCAVASLGTPARAADEKAQCLAEHADAQVLRNASHLLAAREKLRQCSRPACPPLVAQDCTQWLAEVDEEQPSIVIASKDDRGQDLVDVETSIDGRVVATKLVGTPIEVDPGEHELHLRLPDGRVTTTRIVARDNERARLVAVTFPPFPPGVAAEGPSPRRHAVPALFWALGGVSLASAIPWAIFGIDGFVQKGDLDASCGLKASCSGAQIDAVHRDFVIADVTGGVSLAVAAVAAVVFVVPRRRADSTAVEAGLLGPGLLSIAGRF